MIRIPITEEPTSRQRTTDGGLQTGTSEPGLVSLSGTLLTRTREDRFVVGAANAFGTENREP